MLAKKDTLEALVVELKIVNPLRAVRKWLALGIAFAAMASAAEVPRAEHPRPDFQRDEWINLNGVWEFRFDAEDRGLHEQWWQPAASYDRRITVPFCWESKLSGIRKVAGAGETPDRIEIGRAHV